MIREGSIIEHPGHPQLQLLLALLLLSHPLPNSSAASQFVHYPQDSRPSLARNESMSQYLTGFNSRSGSDAQPYGQNQFQYPPPPPQQQPPPPQQQQHPASQQLPHPMNPPTQPPHHLHHHHSSSQTQPNAGPAGPTGPTAGQHHPVQQQDFYPNNDYNNHRTYSTEGQYYEYPPNQHTQQLAGSAQGKDLDSLQGSRRQSDLLDSFAPGRPRANSYFNRPRQLSIMPFDNSSSDFDSFLKRDSIRGLLNYNGDLLEQIPNFQDQDFQQQQFKNHSRNGSNNGFTPNGRYQPGLFDPAATLQDQKQDLKNVKKPVKKLGKRNELNNYTFPKDVKVDLANTYNNPENSRLVPLQQVMQSDDGRPLLGATKVDQLMLVIEARNKGINKLIPRTEDGSILDDQRNDGVLPQPIDLVGGVEKHTLSKTKNYQCNYCSKKFTQSTHLEVHVRSHIGYKPYQCNYCGKRFTQGGNLRTHLRLHTGERPFECDICDRKFSRKGNLQLHKLTHEHLKPYECHLDNCNKSFTQLGNLKSHQNRFHLNTLNNLTKKLADLGGANEEDILFKIENLPYDEQNLLKYFTSTYKNLNRGIRGRGKKIATANSETPMIAPPLQQQQQESIQKTTTGQTNAGNSNTISLNSLPQK